MYSEYYDNPYDCFEDQDLRRPKHDWDAILDQATEFEEFLGDGVKKRLNGEPVITPSPQVSDYPASEDEETIRLGNAASRDHLRRLSIATIHYGHLSQIPEECDEDDSDGATVCEVPEASPVAPSSVVESRTTEVSVTTLTKKGDLVAAKAKETVRKEVKFEDLERRRPSAVDLKNLVPQFNQKEKLLLFQEEYGSLPDEGEPEVIIKEFEAAFYNEISIIGVMHITNRRLLFHASLLRSELDPNKDATIVRSGIALDHRHFPHRNRRVHLEMVHDMISACPSGVEKHRVKPFWTILFNDIVSLENPTMDNLAISFHLHGKLRKTISFENSEVAFEWSRELNAALFMYRHSTEDTASEPMLHSHSVNVHIPLEWIEEAFISNLSHLTDIPFGTVNLRLRRCVNGVSELPFAIHDSSGEDLTSQLNALAKARFEYRKETQNFNPRGLVVDFGTFNFPSVRKTHIYSSKMSDDERAIRTAFGIPASEEIFLARAKLTRFLTVGGIFAVTPRFVCYFAPNHTTLDTKYRFIISQIKGGTGKFLMGVGFGLIVHFDGRPDMKFTFHNLADRNSALTAIQKSVRENRRRVKLIEEIAARPVVKSAPSLAEKICSLRMAKKIVTCRDVPPSLLPVMLKPINVSDDVAFHIANRHFVCLTIGSRGDVQPYIALGLALLKEGHRVTIVTHEEYKDWVESFGISHRTAGGDPGALMKLSVENKMFSPAFFKESLGNFRTWLDELLRDSWEQCQDADVLIESPSAMAGVHIAEALEIPYFRAFTMPWTKTESFPHAFISPPVDSPTFNAGSYSLFETVLWTATSGQINKWRKKLLGLRSTDLTKLQLQKTPFLYNFSPAVVPKPMDWSDDITICGYWFLDNPDLKWTPPADLLEFMDRAREDERPLVYIGFGSITVPDPVGLTRSIIEAVQMSGVRAIISQGWSARMTSDSPEEAVEYPEECYVVKSIPHDWLFPQIDAALHHGGAGTTGATLRAGIPTLIKPWFGDQYFWAGRVEKLGAGLEVSSVKSTTLASCLQQATTDVVMKERAAAIGARIRNENGVKEAIHTLYTYMPRAADYNAARRTESQT